MAPDADDTDWVDLSDAIRALRTALEAAWWDGQRKRVRFKLEPVELTVQAGVTRVATGTAGIRWHVIALGGDRSKESASTQTLKLRLMPILFDEDGRPLDKSKQLISDHDEAAAEHPQELSQEPM